MSLCLQCIALNEEEKLCFRDSERTKEYGWIGYLRGDFGRSGEEFHSTWFEGDNPELNNEQFKELFDSVINILRQDGDLFSDMVVANIPLLYCINRDWYDALMNTTFGKVVLAICGVVIIITAIRMNKLTKPIEYKR